MILTPLAFAASLAIPQSDEPAAGLFIERPTVVTTAASTSDPLAFYRIPSGPGPVTPVDLDTLADGFSRDDLFGPGAPAVTFGGFSIGTARIVVTTDGRASIPDAGATWGFLHYSLSQVGAHSDPIYVDELGPAGTGMDGLSGDIFSYWLDESAEIPDGYLTVIEKARDGDSMGVTDIRGMDHTMHAFGLSPMLEDLAEDAAERFYFTLDAASVGLVDDSWFDDDPSLRSSATILMVERAAGGGTWAGPAVFMSWADLGLDVGDVVTAVAVDETNKNVLLGVDDDAKQLWVCNFDDQWENPSYRDIYLSASGANFAKGELRLKNGDRVSGICAGDPGGDFTDESKILVRTFGMPIPERNRARACVEIAASRDYVGDQDLIHVYLGDLPCLGRGPYLARLEISTDWSTSAVYYSLRSARPTEVVRHTFEAPGNYEGDWRLRWIVTGATATVTTHELEIRN